MIDGPPQADRKFWYTKMIVQSIWSITISELETPHSLKWSKGHLRQQTSKQVIIVTLNYLEPKQKVYGTGLLYSV